MRILATGIWCVNLSLVLYGGNFTTEFALPLQFAFLWLIWQAEKEGRYGWRAIALGVLAALLFFTKQTTVAIPAAWLVFVLGRAGLWSLRAHFAHGRFVPAQSQYPARAEIASRKPLAMTLGGFAAGAGAVSLAIAGYFFSQGALDELWDVAFVFNLYYAQSSLKTRLLNMLAAFNYMDAGGLVWLAILGWLVALLSLLRQKAANPRQNARLAVWTVAALALPLEFLLVGASGKVYYHYFITLIPVLAVFAAALFQLLFEALDKYLDRQGDDKQIDGKRLKPLANQGTKPAFAGSGFVRYLIVIVFGAAAALGSYNAYAENWEEYDRDNLRSKVQQKVVNAIQELSGPEDFVLAWGAETGFNFLSQRRSPTRFAYQYPLYRGYASEYASLEKVRSIFRRAEEKPPQVILVPSYAGFNAQEFDIKSAEIEEAFQAFAGNYTLTKEIGSFRIYTRNVAGEPGG